MDGEKFGGSNSEEEVELELLDEELEEKTVTLRQKIFQWVSTNN
jgi:hypothetical protein